MAQRREKRHRNSSFQNLFPSIVVLLLIWGGMDVISHVKTEFVRSVYTANLSGAYAAPVVGPESDGLAVCIYNRNLQPKQLECHVQYNIDYSLGPFTAGIYLGGVGDVGPLLYQFTVEVGEYFQETFYLTTLSFSDLSLYSTKQQETDFLNGDWYLQITTPEYMNGISRGNLLQKNSIYAILDSSNVIPENNSTASGIALARYQFSPGIATFSVSHSVITPTSISIRRGDKTENGAEDFSFNNDFQSPVLSYPVQYTTVTKKALLNEDQYIQVSSAAYPNGEIRGQLNPIDYLPDVSFTARLDGYSVIPSVVTSATGCALFSLNCSSLILEYFIYHNVMNPTHAAVYFGNQFETGNETFYLSRAESPIRGSIQLNTDTVVLFYQQLLYIQISSFLNPGGEIRGQISDHYNYYAYLHGLSTLPPTSTSGLGCATFRMAEDTSYGRVLDYYIHFNSKFSETMSVELLYGNPGSEGSSQFLLGGDYTQSPVIGTDVKLNKAQVSWFGTSSMYVQVSTYPSEFIGAAGELRGQIYGIKNPCPIKVNGNQLPHKYSSTTNEYILPSSFAWSSHSTRVSPSFELLFTILSLCFLLFHYL